MTFAYQEIISNRKSFNLFIFQTDLWVGMAKPDSKEGLKEIRISKKVSIKVQVKVNFGSFLAKEDHWTSGGLVPFWGVGQVIEDGTPRHLCL